MKKTRIAFADIKAGDLIEVVIVDAGVKSIVTGIAFEKEDWKPNERLAQSWWKTSEGGMIVNDQEPAEIYHIDVTPVKFEDIRKGDLLEITTDMDDAKVIVRGRAAYRSEGTSNDYWVTESGGPLVTRLSDVTVEILERPEA